MKTENHSENKKNTKSENSHSKGESRINAEHPNKEKQDPEDIYPQDNSCDASKMVTESFRIDDNSDLSTTATTENKCIGDSIIPGVGLEESDRKKDSGK
ncbi:MAG: hypothetical protein LBQ22_01275 [Bacteroidales bacterium]|jgi:hypothetical protein|nr:hypothetical protein [Bacteroidales bacterium]